MASYKSSLSATAVPKPETPEGLKYIKIPVSKQGSEGSLLTNISAESDWKEDELMDADIEKWLELLNPPCKSRYNNGHLSKASQITKSLHNPEMKMDRPYFWSDDERVKTYELVVSLLKYSAFLKDALEVTRFYKKFPKIRALGEEAVLVVLYNLLERGFRVSPADFPLSDRFSEIQSAVLAYRTKLMAHMARLRIKHQATSIDHLLPENLRHQHNIDKNPLYAWVNLRRISKQEVIFQLRRTGFTQTDFEDDVLIKDTFFCVDKNHPDLIRFHSSQAEVVQTLPIVQKGRLVIQDKSACIFVYALLKALFFKEAMNGSNSLSALNGGGGGIPTSDPFTSNVTSILSMNEWYDGILDGTAKNFVRPECVVVTHCGSGRSAAHLACLMVEAVPKHITRSQDMCTDGDLCKAIQSKFISRPPLFIHAFGVPHDKFAEVSNVFRKQFGLNNFRLFTDEFVDLDEKDSRIRGAAAILVNPPSSGSALKDPVAYICSEGGDESVLTHLAKYVSSTISEEGYRSYTSEQVRSLKLALGFPHVKLIMYTTCSSLRCENWDVIHSCLANVRFEQEVRKSQILKDILAKKSLRYFRDVCYEVVNLSKVMEGYPDSHFQGNCIEIPPSSASSGVFVTLIRRRDRAVYLGRNPIKSFINAQVAVVPNKTELGPIHFENSQASVVDVKSTSLLTTVEDWSRYISDKYNFDIDPQEMKDQSGDCSVVSVPLEDESSMFKFGRRKMSKRAIVKRIATPTFASLAKQKDKVIIESSFSRPSTPGDKTFKSRFQLAPPSGRKPFGNFNVPELIACQGANHPGGCICTRHAKKFPEFENRR